jgi:hypothetical protein
MGNDGLARSSSQRHSLATSRLLRRSEIAAVENLLDGVLTDVRVLCDRFPMLPRAMAAPVSVLMIVEGPELRPQAIAKKVCLALWTLALDDLLDQGSLKTDGRTVLSNCRKLTAHLRDGKRPGDELSGTLFELMQDSCHSRMWGPIEPFWAKMFEKCIRGWAYEDELARTWRAGLGNAGPPSFDEYMAHARYSVALPWVLLAGLALSEDPSLVAALPELTLLAEQCGVVGRLSNDLGGWQREKLEQKQINAVAIVAAADAMSVEADQKNMLWESARAKVSQLRDRELRSAKRLCATINTASGLEKGFFRVTELLAAVYAAEDFRYWAPVLNERG